jgi:hypothetical protein
MNVDSRLGVGILALAIGGAIVVGIGIGTYALQMTMAQPVDAEVVSSGVDTVACSVDESCDVEYVPVVEYRYSYDGTEYTSDSVYPQAAGHRSITEDGAARTASKYAAGDSVTAHVLPMMPDTAYLRTNTPGIAQLVLGAFGLLLVLAGLSGIYQSLRGIEPEHAVR